MQKRMSMGVAEHEHGHARQFADPCTLSSDRDLIRISSVRRDILSHPFHRRSLILESIVSAGGDVALSRLGAQGRVCEEAVRTGTVAEVHHDESTAAAAHESTAWPLRTETGDETGA
jgi:hypothetical protein